MKLLHLSTNKVNNCFSSLLGLQIVFKFQLRVCHKLTAKLKREVVLGSSSLDDPAPFITVIKLSFLLCKVCHYPQTKSYSENAWGFLNLQRLKMLTENELSLDDLQI